MKTRRPLSNTPVSTSIFAQCYKHRFHVNIQKYEQNLWNSKVFVLFYCTFLTLQWDVTDIKEYITCTHYRPNAKVPVMISRYTISLTCVLKTKDHLDNPIVLCMIVRLIVYSAYHYSPFAFGLLRLITQCKVCSLFQALNSTIHHRNPKSYVIPKCWELFLDKISVTWNQKNMKKL
jgi:hypothetical protein